MFKCGPILILTSSIIFYQNCHNIIKTRRTRKLPTKLGEKKSQINEFLKNNRSGEKYIRAKKLKQFDLVKVDLA
uniref:Uncharacterized protein n=1 Tax=Lepeophtheirus salmonis TaxID=72036 RepID=A0A0K2UNY1_LEPSM